MTSWELNECWPARRARTAKLLPRTRLPKIREPTATISSRAASHSASSLEKELMP